MVHHNSTPCQGDEEFDFQHLMFHPSNSSLAVDVNDQGYFSQSASDLPNDPYRKHSLIGYDSFLHPTATGQHFPNFSSASSDFGMGINYPPLSEADSTDHFPQSRNSIAEQPTLSASLPAQLVPISTFSNQDAGHNTARALLATRSASPLPRPIQEETHRATKAPAKPKRSRTSKASQNLKVPGPLSIMTKDLTNIPIRDMMAWVNRSTAQRLEEVAKKDGRIVRPMNSFMLYRAAYQDRTKAWCHQNNHQIVSQISGDSWAVETDEIKAYYNKLASIERDNHAKAHPNYKFSPTKATTKHGSTSSTVQPVVHHKKRISDAGWLSDDEDADGDVEAVGEDADLHEARPRSERKSVKLARRYQNRPQQIQRASTTAIAAAAAANSSAPMMRSYSYGHYTTHPSVAFGTPNWNPNVHSRPLSSSSTSSALVQGYLHQTPRTEHQPFFNPSASPVSPFSQPQQLRRQPSRMFNVPNSGLFNTSSSMPASLSPHAFGDFHHNHNLHTFQHQPSRDAFAGYDPNAQSMFTMRVDPAGISESIEQAQEPTPSMDDILNAEVMFDCSVLDDDWMNSKVNPVSNPATAS